MENEKYGFCVAPSEEEIGLVDNCRRVIFLPALRRYTQGKSLTELSDAILRRLTETSFQVIISWVTTQEAPCPNKEAFLERIRAIWSAQENDVNSCS